MTKIRRKKKHREPDLTPAGWTVIVLAIAGVVGPTLIVLCGLNDAQGATRTWVIATASTAALGAVFQVYADVYEQQRFNVDRTGKTLVAIAAIWAAFGALLTL